MIEVGVREFVRNWKKYMDKEVIITKRGETLGRWIPITEEDGKQVAKVSVNNELETVEATVDVMTGEVIIEGPAKESSSNIPPVPSRS